MCCELALLHSVSCDVGVKLSISVLVAIIFQLLVTTIIFQLPLVVACVTTITVYVQFLPQVYFETCF